MARWQDALAGTGRYHYYYGTGRIVIGHYRVADQHAFIFGLDGTGGGILFEG